MWSIPGIQETITDFQKKQQKKDKLPLSPEKPKMKKRIKRDRQMYLDNIN